MEKLEIVCPAGTLSAAIVAIDEGADCIYFGFNDETNARNFPGLNFSREEAAEAILYAHSKNCKAMIAINTYMNASSENKWFQAVDDAIILGADAVILADIGLLAYARDRHPKAKLHLSVQASASTISNINFFVEEFGVRRVVLPRVLTLGQIRDLNNSISVETEIFAFGGMCPMAEGRCYLSSYITGKSPNSHGVCSPASHVKYLYEKGELVSRLGDFTINKFDKNELAGYPTLCKGRFKINDDVDYFFEDPVSLNVLENLTEVVNTGVSALKIEGRQRGKAYVKEVVRTFRKAIDDFYNNLPHQHANLTHLCEGGKVTTGAYYRKWR